MTVIQRARLARIYCNQYDTLDYSGTFIKRTPLGGQPFGRYRGVVFIERFREPTTVCPMSQFLLQMNLGALLTAYLAHTSFDETVGTSYSYIIDHDCFKIMLSQLLILGVAVRSGRLFSIAKADWVLESCSLYGVERWPFQRGCFTLKSL